MNEQLIPIGIEDFKEIIDKNYYYIDKSHFISNVLSEKVVLYTRPRRFGKTLNMSMLYYYFSNNEKDNSYLFNDLNISKNIEALKHQNQYPVIFISLKDMKRNTYDLQIQKFADIISDEIAKNLELLTCDRIHDQLKKTLNSLYYKQASIGDLMNSLLDLSKALNQYYQQKVVILIDEYDVPLQQAYLKGYYEEMVEFLKNLFSAALKTNNILEKGIMTGCLRIARESIFTGLNNFKVNSIFDRNSNDCFGFTTTEVEQLLKDYSIFKYMDTVKEWYDGYLFGNEEIYNPWSVLNYVSNTKDGDYHPTSFWANTSSNDIVYNYIKADNNTLRKELKSLIEGKSIKTHIKPELTYREMDDINNIYSFLLYTGYLKPVERLSENQYNLSIPNREVKNVYLNQFKEWYNNEQTNYRSQIIEALLNKDINQANILLNKLLSKTISYFDSSEAFYHGFLSGLFSELPNHEVKSNKEYGDGRPDLALIPISIFDTGIIIECKISKTQKDLRKESEKACKQIIEKKYIEGFLEQEYQSFIGYGIAFYKKSCFITLA